jgi:tetratricopeptide (TPR) repeat protein
MNTFHSNEIRKPLPVKPKLLCYCGKKIPYQECCMENRDYIFTEKDLAEEMINDTWELNPGKYRVDFINTALKVYPHMPDAWNLLAQELCKNSKEEVEFYRKAIAAGEIDLGTEFFVKNVGHFWGIIESRPYMRAKFALANALWEIGLKIEAISHLNDSLRLNPNDNQGVRYNLILWLLSIDDLKSVSEFVAEKAHGPNSFAFANFNQVLYLFKKYGNSSQKFKAALQNAHKCNPLVAKYLTGELKIPKKEPAHYSLGSKEEAIIYASMSIKIWKETPEIINVLKDLI